MACLRGTAAQARRTPGLCQAGPDGSTSRGPKFAKANFGFFMRRQRRHIKKPRSQGEGCGAGGRQVGENLHFRDHTRGGVVIGNRHCTCYATYDHSAHGWFVKIRVKKLLGSGMIHCDFPEPLEPAFQSGFPGRLTPRLAHPGAPVQCASSQLSPTPLSTTSGTRSSAAPAMSAGTCAIRVGRKSSSASNTSSSWTCRIIRARSR